MQTDVYGVSTRRVSTRFDPVVTHGFGNAESYRKEPPEIREAVLFMFWLEFNQTTVFDEQNTSLETCAWIRLHFNNLHL